MILLLTVTNSITHAGQYFNLYEHQKPETNM